MTFMKSENLHKKLRGRDRMTKFPAADIFQTWKHF